MFLDGPPTVSPSATSNVRYVHFVTAGNDHVPMFLAGLPTWTYFGVSGGVCHEDERRVSHSSSRLARRHKCLGHVFEDTKTSTPVVYVLGRSNFGCGEQ